MFQEPPRRQVALCITLLAVATTDAGVYQKTSVGHPEYPGRCWYEEENETIALESTVPSKNFCGQVSCSSLGSVRILTITTCGVGKPDDEEEQPSECKLLSGGRGPYPQCCQRWITCPNDATSNGTGIETVAAVTQSLSPWVTGHEVSSSPSQKEQTTWPSSLSEVPVNFKPSNSFASPLQATETDSASGTAPLGLRTQTLEPNPRENDGTNTPQQTISSPLLVMIQSEQPLQTVFSSLPPESVQTTPSNNSLHIQAPPLLQLIKFTPPPEMIPSFPSPQTTTYGLPEHPTRLRHHRTLRPPIVYRPSPPPPTTQTTLPSATTQSNPPSRQTTVIALPPATTPTPTITWAIHSVATTKSADSSKSSIWSCTPSSSTTSSAMDVTESKYDPNSSQTSVVPLARPEAAGDKSANYATSVVWSCGVAEESEAGTSPNSFTAVTSDSGVEEGGKGEILQQIKVVTESDVEEQGTNKQVWVQLFQDLY